MNYQLALQAPEVSALSLLNDHYGMMSSLIRLAAIKHFDVFNYVWNHRHVEEFEVRKFAEGLNLDERAAMILLCSLIASGDLKLEEDTSIRLTERSRLYLTDEAAYSDLDSYLGLLSGPPCLAAVIDSIGESLKQNSELPFLGSDKPLYGGGKAQKSHNDDRESAKRDALAMAARARCLMPLLIEKAALCPSDGTLVSIGCGPAVYSIGFLLKYGQLKVIAFDHENKRETAEKFAEANGVQDRFQFKAGDMFDDELPKGDFHLLSSVFHDWSERRCVELLKRLFDVAPRLLIHDVFPHIWNRFSKPQADYSALLGLITPGMLYSTVEMEAMLQEAGYAMVDQPRPTTHLYSYFWAERN